MRLPVRPVGLVFLALAAVLAVAPPAAAAPVPVTLDCQAQPPIGSPQQFTLSTSVDGVAPATVASGGAFQVTLATDPITVPGEAGGYRVDRLRDLDLRVPVPQGSTFQSATLTGGSNLGPGIPDVFQSDGVVTVRIPGPIPGGATFQPPALHLTLTASGDPGTTINTRLAGTGYADPGLTLTATVRIGFLTVDLPAACFPNPSSTLTSTTIEAPPSS